MQFNPSPKRGEIIRVRDSDGLIKEAFYDRPHGNIYGGITHMVYVDDECKLASSHFPRKARFPEFYDRVRFVYPIEQMENYKAKN